MKQSQLISHYIIDELGKLNVLYIDANQNKRMEFFWVPKRKEKTDIKIQSKKLNLITKSTEKLLPSFQNVQKLLRERLCKELKLQ